MEKWKASGAVPCATLVLLSVACSSSFQQRDLDELIRCEGLVAVGSGRGFDRLVVAFRNLSDTPIQSFTARYEMGDEGEVIAGVDFVCDAKTTRMLDSGDEVPFVFAPGELALVTRVHFFLEKLPDRMFVTTERKIAQALQRKTLIAAEPGVSQRCVFSEVILADGTVFKPR